MPKLSKKRRSILKKYNLNNPYSVRDAIEMVKETGVCKFDCSVDVAVSLGVDPKKADQMLRSTVVLPHGSGKKMRVLALCTSDKENEAKDAGADYVGLDDYIEKIKNGWLEVDSIVAVPAVMVKVGKLGKVLGPRNLMPNPKSGTVSMDIGKSIAEIKSGRISFKSDKYGIVHSSIGRLSFSSDNLYDNFIELLSSIVRVKPSSSKGIYILNVSLTSTMGVGVTVDKTTIPNI
jgi:large subunit ribosomal protein L1